MRPYVWITACFLLIQSGLYGSDIQADTIYQYRDRDGKIVFTDNPPPGVNAQLHQKTRSVTINELQALEKDKAKTAENDAKQASREDKIQAARQEYEQAQKDMESYHLKKNQAADPYIWWQWNNRIEEQNKLIEDKRKKLQEAESGP